MTLKSTSVVLIVMVMVNSFAMRVINHQCDGHGNDYEDVRDDDDHCEGDSNGVGDNDDVYKDASEGSGWDYARE
jgi:hypothetical protein